MSSAFDFRRLDVSAFAQARGALSGQLPLAQLPRLAQALHAAPDGAALHWQAQGEHRSAADGSTRPALRLRVQAALPLTCQRCLDGTLWQADVDRHFLFVPDEATAAALDDVSEDDVLVQARDFDLAALIEDEMLMALPLVPRHEDCPSVPVMSVESEGFAQEQARAKNPFAALAGLKRDVH